ncbi:hypothetical protein [Streptomyces sp. NPDC005283]|uniref:hypothetical protein n=1 Tax=Streptomyces sp. NPDC005283 TaxID=3156871 RepID=UPI0034519390
MALPAVRGVDEPHTDGPVGAQGSSQAPRDAAALHPAREDRDTISERLRLYGKQRRTAAVTAHRVRRIQARELLGEGGPAATFTCAAAAGLVTRTALEARITGRIAHGVVPVPLPVETACWPYARAAGVRVHVRGELTPPRRRSGRQRPVGHPGVPR